MIELNIYLNRGIWMVNNMNQEDIKLFEELKNEVRMDEDGSIRDETLSKIKEIEIKYNRLFKSSKMQIEELEMEKQILIDNFIKKDNELLELINKNSKKRIIRRLIGRLRRKRKKDV